MNEQVQQEIWGEDPDTWMCSTYMPAGLATPVDGGYRFSGRWSFSSGAGRLGLDHPRRDLTANAVDAPGTIDMAQAIADPNRYLHFILPSLRLLNYRRDVGRDRALRGRAARTLWSKTPLSAAYRTVQAIDIVEGDHRATTACRRPTGCRGDPSVPTP